MAAHARNVPHKLPSASRHIRVVLLNIQDPDYVLAQSRELRVSLNLGPVIGADIFAGPGRRPLLCKRNGLLIIPPDQEVLHRSNTPKAAGFHPPRVATFFISSELLADCQIELGLKPGEVEIVYQAIEPSAVLLPLAQALLADLSEGSPDGAKASESLAKALITRLLIRLHVPERAVPADSPLTRVCHHIETGLQTPLTLQALADVAGMSPFHFCRVFREGHGQSPHQYIMKARVEAACRLLWDSGETGAPSSSMLEIALACGFNSSSHFSTQFKRETGESPVEWRARRKSRSAGLAACATG
ncbi:MAG: AraC family transcriptional regulator [Rhizobacter sp.]|nr:AraC family transcriptional regulator [Rhizobacter sp.]